jgi:hypothetical protein
MTQTRNETRTAPFSCNLIGDTVEIRRDFKIRVARNGDDLARVVVGTRCSHMDKCAIATRKAASTSYDWSKCLFLQAAKAAAE